MSFTWKKFYNELFLKIANEYDSESLATLAYEIFPEVALMDQDKEKKIRLEEFEPCTFLARFNRKEKIETRIEFCRKAKDALTLNSPVPSDFDGIPTFQNMAYWFFPYKKDRRGHEFKTLWAFAKILAKGEINEETFNSTRKILGAGPVYVPTICFIVWPEKYLPTDTNTINYISEKRPILNSAISEFRKKKNPYLEYINLLEAVKREFPDKSGADISLAAYLESLEGAVNEPIADESVQFWAAGTTWKSKEKPKDKSNEFLEKGIWLNDYAPDSSDPSIKAVKRAKTGDYIAMKGSFTKGTGNKKSFLRVKGLGKIVENYKDGVRLKVNWIYRGPPFDLEGISFRKTFEIIKEQKYIDKIFSPILITKKSTGGFMASPADAKKDWSKPRNIIYWGPPGTGKTRGLLELRTEFEGSPEKESKDRTLKWVQELTWWEIVAASMVEIGKPVGVPELFQHEFIQLKTKISDNRTPQATIWVALQTHAIGDSKTVNYTRRLNPQIVDKTKDYKWFLTNDWEEQLADIIEGVQSLRKGGHPKTNRYEIVTFHQSYSYEEFVEGIRPKIENEGVDLSYEIKPGIFAEICGRAVENPDEPYALFIDEINRGNLSKIFGELISLIEPDKRIGMKNEIRVTLPYSRRSFGVPKNLHLIGTMNSVDRSLALVDMALRRRFEFVAFRPKPTLVSENLEGIALRKVFEKLNNKIGVILGSEYQLGHSYYMEDNASSVAAFKKTWFGNVLPLLQEYLFDDWEKIKVLVGKFVVETPVSGLESVAVLRSSYCSFIDQSIQEDKFIELMKALE